MPTLLAPPPAEDVTRRDLLRGTGAALLVATLPGCGGGSGSADAEPEGRTVRHLGGTTTVPVDPRRVAVLSVMDLDCAVSLDAPLVAAPGWFPEHAYLRGLLAEAGELIDLGAEETSLETLAAAEPDLILGEVWNEDLYEQLSGIAATVLIPQADWKQGLDLVAQALGREERAETVREDHERRVEQLRQELGARLETLTVSVVRSRPDALRLYGAGSFSGGVLADVGLARPAAQRFDDIQVDVSLEQAADADADAIFVWSYDPEERTEQRRLQANPLWQRLDAVRRGRVYEVGEHWYGAGPASAGLVLDDLSRYLAGGAR